MGARPSRLLAAAAAVILSAAVAPPAQAQTPGLAYAEFVIASYDADGDGQISRLEFSATGRANFDEIDRNFDGVASAEEIAAWYVRYISG